MNCGRAGAIDGPEIAAFDRRPLYRPARRRVGGGFTPCRSRAWVGTRTARRPRMAERFPVFCVPAGWSGLYEPRAGFLLPERIVAAQAENAMRAGAELHGREPVTEWEAGRRRDCPHAPGGIPTARLIFCGGAWSSRLVNDLGVKLRVTRQVLGWVWPRRPEAFSLGEFPVWAIDKPDGSIYYGFPIIPASEATGLKVAWHGPGAETDPDHVVRDLQPGDEETFRAGAETVSSRRRRPAAGDAYLPLHQQPRPPLHHRPPSASRERHDRLRLQRARVQVRVGDRRTARGPGDGGEEQAARRVPAADGERSFRNAPVRPIRRRVRLR